MERRSNRPGRFRIGCAKAAAAAFLLLLGGGISRVKGGGAFSPVARTDVGRPFSGIVPPEAPKVLALLLAHPRAVPLFSNPYWIEVGLGFRHDGDMAHEEISTELIEAFIPVALKAGFGDEDWSLLEEEFLKKTDRVDEAVVVEFAKKLVSGEKGAQESIEKKVDERMAQLRKEEEPSRKNLVEFYTRVSFLASTLNSPKLAAQSLQLWEHLGGKSDSIRRHAGFAPEFEEVGTEGGQSIVSLEEVLMANRRSAVFRSPLIGIGKGDLEGGGDPHGFVIVVSGEEKKRFWMGTEKGMRSFEHERLGPKAYRLQDGPRPLEDFEDRDFGNFLELDSEYPQVKLTFGRGKSEAGRGLSRPLLFFRDRISERWADVARRFADREGSARRETEVAEENRTDLTHFMITGMVGLIAAVVGLVEEYLAGKNTNLMIFLALVALAAFALVGMVGLALRDAFRELFGRRGS